MDSYTDVRGQCCGCRHVSCNTSGPSGRGSFRQTEYPDMNTFPWAVNNDYNVAPAESFAGGQYTGGSSGRLPTPLKGDWCREPFSLTWIFNLIMGGAADDQLRL